MLSKIILPQYFNTKPFQKHYIRNAISYLLIFISLSCFAQNSLNNNAKYRQNKTNKLIATVNKIIKNHLKDSLFHHVKEYHEVHIGHVFNKQNKYVVERYFDYNSWVQVIKISIIDSLGKIHTYLKYKGLSALAFIKCEIKDINGDHRKDFLIHWYPESGCCLRDIYYVWLNKRNGQFTERYEFVNPTFSATEKIIRGIEYGHAGETPIYKFKWNKYHVDTIEYIYPNSKNKGLFYKQKSRNATFSVPLKKLPNEYINIKGIDWFTDK